MAAKGERSGAEVVKENSRQLRGTIAGELAKESDHFEKADVALLKFHGTYQQDDREARKQRKPGEDKSVRSYMFMVRSKIPGGKISAKQFLTELDLAERYGNGTLRITTRQGLQLHGVLKQNLWATIHEINACLLSTLGACGDVNRNVMCCPAPHHGDGVHDQMQQIADRIAAHLAPRTRAYHEIWLNGERLDSATLGASIGANLSPDQPEGCHAHPIPAPAFPASEEPIYGRVYMPRKFKIGIGLPEDNCIDIYANDLGFLGVVEGGRLVGFNVLVGGGMGMTPAKKETFPALAKRLGFVGVDEVIDVATAVVGVQRDFGRRDDRSQARLKYLVNNWGIEKFKAKVEEYLGRKLAELHPADVTALDDHLGWHAQGDGKCYLGVNVENGRVQDTDGVQSKSALRELFEKFGPLGMSGRLTPLQSILLTDLEPDWREEIERTLREHGVLPHTEISNALRFSMACPAVPTCGLAVTESERALPSVIDELEIELAKLGLAAERFSIHMTGCPNGCARPYNCDIGLVGKAALRYTIYVGGNLLGTRLNFLLKDLVPHAEIVCALMPLFFYFKADRRTGESFGDFCHRKGRDELLRFDAEHQGNSLPQQHGDERPAGNEASDRSLRSGAQPALVPANEPAIPDRKPDQSGEPSTDPQSAVQQAAAVALPTPSSPTPATVMTTAATQQSQILAALTSAPLDRVRLMHTIFLVWHRQGRPRAGPFQFRPYLYGPCALDLYAALDELERRGLVVKTPHSNGDAASYHVTDAGQAAVALDGVDSKDREEIRETARWAAAQSTGALLVQVYAEAPDFAVRSVLQ